MHVGEAVVAALEFAGELLVVNAGAAHHSSQEIASLDFVLVGMAARFMVHAA
jgi:uncharacterized protein YjlB